MNCCKAKLSVFLLLTLFISSRCVPVTTTTGSADESYLVYKNSSYFDYIKTVKLDVYPKSPIKNVPIALSIQSNSEYVLSFDDLTEDVQDYMVKIIHCNANWSPSTLRSIDYLFEFNEFRITDNFLSLDTKIPYIHYEFRVPKVKIPGNYLIVVYEEGYPENPVLSQRFSVFSSKVSFIEDDFISQNNMSGHRINFSIDYTGLEGITDPFTELKATLIQNGNWNKAISLLKPTFVRQDISRVDFRDFNEMIFNPGNEFRFFDLRSVISPGPNVLRVERQTDSLDAYIIHEKPRSGLAYTFYRDLNGYFETFNYDSENSSYHSQYTNVHFNLETEKLPHDVYITGQLTNWNILPEAKLNYDYSSGSYKGSLLLKQGWYDYMYHYNSPEGNYNYIEGNHINTENFYEILIYKTVMGQRDQQLIGYYQFGLNERLR